MGSDPADTLSCRAKTSERIPVVRTVRGEQKHHKRSNPKSEFQRGIGSAEGIGNLCGGSNAPGK